MSFLLPLGACLLGPLERSKCCLGPTIQSHLSCRCVVPTVLYDPRVWIHGTRPAWPLSPPLDPRFLLRTKALSGFHLFSMIKCLLITSPGLVTVRLDPCGLGRLPPSVRSWGHPGCGFPALTAIRASPQPLQILSSPAGLDTLPNQGDSPSSRLRVAES